MTRANRLVLLGACLLSLGLAGCQRSAALPAKAATPPAKVTGGVKEDQLTTVELTETAERRLGIQTAAVEMRSLPRHRVFGGEVALPTGATIVVSAPLAGTLQSPSDATVLKVGAVVREKQVVLKLLPLLSPERAVLTPSERIRFAEARNAIATSRIDALGQVEQARVQVEAAQIALDRAERLLKENAGTVRAVDEARAALAVSQKALTAATARKKQVDELKLDDESDSGSVVPLNIEAPHGGIVRAAHALPGEVVAAGAPLFEVVDFETLWVRVPVYVGEVSSLATDRPASVGELAARADSPRLAAQPIDAPPTATALASTIDLYYELVNPKQTFRPGQRVSVSVPLIDEQEQRAVPWSAVVRDIHGGHWVYERTAPHTFVRRRVDVKQVVDSWAVLERGPAVGAVIATTGVAELFGTDFGFGK